VTLGPQQGCKSLDERRVVVRQDHSRFHVAFRRSFIAVLRAVGPAVCPVARSRLIVTGGNRWARTRGVMQTGASLPATTRK
jgi:hypothetical protein